MALNPFGSLWSLARKVEDLFDLQTKVRESLLIVDERLRAIENRLIKLESEQSQVITAAGAAATGAASSIAGGIISDAVTRITRLEGRTEQLETRLVLPGRNRPE
jgi:phage shock protein A